MSFFLSILAGGIGAALISGGLPQHTLSGILNTAIGVIAGTAVWAMTEGMSFAEPSITGLVTVIALCGFGGAVASLTLGILRNVLLRK